MQMHSRPSAGSRRQGPAWIQKGNKPQAEKKNHAKNKLDPQQDEKDDAPALKPGTAGYNFFNFLLKYLFNTANPKLGILSSDEVEYVNGMYLLNTPSLSAGI